MVENQFGEMPKPTELIKDEKTADQYVSQFTEGGLKVIQDLEREVSTMKLASRFNRDTTLSDIQEQNPNFVPTPETERQIQEEGEAGIKRAQLLADLRLMQSQLDSLGSSLKRFILDMNASQKEF